MNDRTKHFRISSGVLITAGLILLLAMGLFFLLRSGILTPNPDDEAETFGDSVNLSEMEDPGEESIRYFDLRDREPAELLMDLTEARVYIWSFRSIEAWENDYTVERVTVSRQEAKYRIESDNLLVICDGEQVYRKEGMLVTLCPAEKTDLYREAGLTSLDFIRENAANGTMEYDDPINVKYIRVKQFGDGVRSEYDISVETGLPVNERSYMGNMAYRMVLTDFISVQESEQPSGEVFEIPNND